MKKGLFFKIDTDNPEHKVILDFFNDVDRTMGKRHKTRMLYELVMSHLRHTLTK